MDLAHLVTVGLFPAKHEPLTSADLAYFRQHGVDDALAEIVSQLAKQKPTDPYKFIADAMAQKNGGAPGAVTKAEKPEKKADAKAAPKAAAKAEAAPAAAPAGAVNTAEVEKVGAELRALKEKLKQEGKSGKEVNATPEVQALVARLNDLKSGGAAGSPKAESKAKAEAAPAAAPAGAVNTAEVEKVGAELRALKEKLKQEGKSGKEVNSSPEVQALVARLNDLKSGGAAGSPKAESKAEAKGKAKKEKAPKPEAEGTVEKTKQQAKGGGLVNKKADNVPEWYAEVIGKGQLIEKYPVKGCFILRPWAYKLWEQIQGWLDKNIKEIGVENCYFPMFIPKCYMEKESDHLEDFAPELAMVTKFGNEDIDEPVAIRPTSETAMYAAYSDWVQSHRDLPIKLNQWCSVVRWEVKQTTPFLRTREFLWQEGHTAFAEKAPAEAEVLAILELYARVYEELLAVPVVRGTKTKAETFPGADYTTTVEAFIPATGRAIQGATSHHLGQNFSKMFEISFQDPKDPTGQKIEYAYQNSWGLTQRTIGVMVMVHGDDKGLVLPPNAAGIQVVMVPVGIKATSTEEEKKTLAQVSKDYEKKLSDAGIRVLLDDDNSVSPGWKFNQWEMKGVPLRIELGPMDISKGQFMMAKRTVLDPKEKVVGKHESLVEDVKRTLQEIHDQLYSKSLAERDSRMASIDKWEDFSPNLNAGKLVLIPFCGEPECEDKIKEKSKEEAQEVEVAGGLKMGAKSLCVPHEEKYQKDCPSKCIFPDCPNNNVKQRTLFGRSY